MQRICKRMPKPGTKVRDLAKELGVTSRELIDRCRADGLAVQNRISRLNADQVRSIRKAFLSSNDGGATTES